MSKFCLICSYFQNTNIVNFHRNLKEYDPDNFGTEKVQGYFKKAEEFVQDLYDQQHMIGLWIDRITVPRLKKKEKATYHIKRYFKI
jgi:hypothetical protein